MTEPTGTGYLQNIIFQRQQSEQKKSKKNYSPDRIDLDYFYRV